MKRRRRILIATTAGVAAGVAALVWRGRAASPSRAEPLNAVPARAIAISPNARRMHEIIEKAHDESGKRGSELDALLRDWAMQDAAEAADFVLTLSDDALRRECLLGIMRAWGERDAAAALIWGEGASFENAHEREIMMSMACTAAARVDPRAAVTLGLAHGLEGFRTGVMAALVAQWAEVDLLAVSAWVKTRDPGANRDALVANVALVIAEAEPAEAMRWALANSEAGEGRDRLVAELADCVARRDPGLATTWVESLLAGSSRERALGRLAYSRSE